MLVIVPFAVTAWVLVYLVSFLEKAVRLLPDAVQPENLFGFPIPGLGILLAVTTVLLVGLATNNYFGRRLVDLSERILSRLPLVSSLYTGIKQLMEALFASERGSFRQVVLIEWPRKGSRVIAFHTGEAFIRGDDGQKYANVFMPSTPNPTTGFYLVLPAEEVIALDLTVEEAFKLIMSAGMVAPETPMIIDDSGVHWSEDTEDVSFLDDDSEAGESATPPPDLSR